MGRLLGNLIPLTVERQTPFWFSSGGNKVFTSERMPVFIVEEERNHYFYGIPEVGHGVKVARHHEGESVDPDDVQRTVTEDDELQVSVFISKRLPKLNQRSFSSTTCLYTNTPDSNFVVDAHPKDEDVVLVSACSGHGFKFTSVVGEIAADLAAEGRTRHDISFLNVRRFTR